LLGREEHKLHEKGRVEEEAREVIVDALIQSRMVLT
jgi:hypothetical protein